MTPAPPTRACRGATPARMLCVRLGAGAVVIASLVPLVPLGLQPPPATPPGPQATPAASAPPLALTPIWSITLPAPPVRRPAFDAGRAYVPLRGGALVALSLATGVIEWSVESVLSGAPAAGDGFVFLPAGDAVVALAATTGATAWRQPSDSRISSRLLWAPNWLVGQTEAGTVFALNPRDGARIWEQTLGSQPSALPSFTADVAYVPLVDGRFVAVDRATGRLLWTAKLGGPPTESLPLRDRVFVGSTDNYFYCLDARNGHVKWRWVTGGDLTGRPAADDRTVYFVSLDNQLRALRLGNGHQRWRQTLLSRPSAGPFLFGDVLLVSGIASSIQAYRRRDGERAGEIAAPDELAAPPHLFRLPDGTTEAIAVLTGSGQMQALGSAPAPAGPDLAAIPGVR